MNLTPVQILLLEDDPAKQCLVMEILKDVKISNDVTVVKTCMEASDFLSQEAGCHRIDLLLFDLNLLRKNEAKLLAQIRRGRALKRIPALVLKISKEERDILKFRLSLFLLRFARQDLTGSRECCMDALP